MPGRSRPWVSTSSVVLTVPVALSTTGLTRSTRALKRSPGNASTVRCARWPTESRPRSFSGTWIGHCSGSNAEMRNIGVELCTCWANLMKRVTIIPVKGARIEV